MSPGNGVGEGHTAMLSISKPDAEYPAPDYLVHRYFHKAISRRPLPTLVQHQSTAGEAVLAAPISQ